MQVTSNGLTFQTSRITGPSHQFLRLVFAEGEGSTVVGSAEVDGRVPSAAQVASASAALATVADRLPVHGRWRVAEALLAAGDHADPSGYALLLRTILAQAEQELPRLAREIA